jgi:hypothetical protein
LTQDTAGSSVAYNRVVQPVGVVESGMIDIVVETARFLAALRRANASSKPDFVA